MSEGRSDLPPARGPQLTARDLSWLQRAARNRAVAGAAWLQRCGPVPCGYPPEEHERARQDMTVSRQVDPGGTGGTPDRAPIMHTPLTSPRFAGDAELQACAAAGQDRSGWAHGAA